MGAAAVAAQADSLRAEAGGFLCWVQARFWSRRTLVQVISPELVAWEFEPWFLCSATGKPSPTPK